MDRCTRGFQFAVAAAAALGLVAPRAQAQWHYYYFKQKQPLTLDVGQVAVFHGEERAAVAAASLSEHGIAANDVRPSVVPRMSIARIPAPDRSEGQVKALVKSVADAGDVEFVSPVFRDSFGPWMVTQHLHVGFYTHVKPEEAEAILARAHAGVIEERNWSRMKGVYRLRSRSRNGFTVLKVANTLAQHPAVKFAEPDMIMTGKTTEVIPNDPGFPNCWGLHNTGQSGGTPDMDMDAPEAWDITQGDGNIIVVVMDLGAQQDHPDLNQIPGFDATGSGTGGGPLNECDNHGTAVAGCVSAIINNALGTVGVAPQCKVGSAKFGIANIPCDGTFWVQSSWLINSLDWALSVGARVTNNSTSFGSSSTHEAKYDQTREAGMVHFTSAGNGGVGQIYPPGAFDSVNAVAALNRNGNKWGSSQYGEGLFISAPGVAIYTTDRTGLDGYAGGDYAWASGTSFASPYTAGVAGLVLSLEPSLTAAEVEQILAETAVDRGDPGYDTMYGWGFVNAHQALLATSPPIQPCELDKLTASDAAAGDEFGYSVSISGDQAVIGARLDTAAATNSGSAYVFRRSDNGTPLDPSDDFWVQEDKLTASDAAADDWFGYSVSISGERAVVSAPADDDAGGSSGSAYTYRRDDNSTPSDPSDDFWVEEDKLTASDAAPGDSFGSSVSTSGDRALVGASTDDDACPGDPICNSGSAYVFRRDDNGTPSDPSDDFWVEEDKLTASDAAAGDYFGISVSISGDRGVVGAVHDDDAGSDSGSAYVFRRDDNGTPSDPGDDFWVQEDKLTASDAAPADRFGDSVSISGDRAVVGAPGDGDAGDNSGSAYVFRRDDNGTPSDPGDDFWVQEDKLTASDAAPADRFGDSVSISGDQAVVGAWGDDDTGPDSGSAYVFRLRGSAWSEDAKLTASDAAAGDYFGASVSISGGRAIVGAVYEDDAPACAPCTDSGSAYVFAVGGDCNRNAVADECDIRDGTSLDIDGDGEPDDCHCSAASPVEPEMIQNALKQLEVSTKNRFLSFSPGDPRENQVIRVKFISLPAPYDQFNGNTMWVGYPFDVSEIAGSTDISPPTFKAAKLQCDMPAAHDWTQLTGDCHGGVCWSSANAWATCTEDSDCVPAIIHVFGEYIVPDGTYEIRVLDGLCDPAEIENDELAPPVLLNTSVYGDVCAGLPLNNQGQWGPPDGTAGITSDVIAVLKKSLNKPGLIKARADLGPGLTDPSPEPDLVISITRDVMYAVQAYLAQPYPFDPPSWPCPP